MNTGNKIISLPIDSIPSTVYDLGIEIVGKNEHAVPGYMFGLGDVVLEKDVWTNSIFQQAALGGMAWALGNVDVTPNIDQVAPQTAEYTA